MYLCNLQNEKKFPATEQIAYIQPFIFIFKVGGRTTDPNFTIFTFFDAFEQSHRFEYLDEPYVQIVFQYLEVERS